MKTRSISAATAIIVCLAVFLCACGKGGADASTTEPSIYSPWSEAQVFTLPTEPQTEAQTSEKQKDAKTDKKATDTDAVLRRIEAARAVYGMFSAYRPQLDKTDSIEVENGLVAYRVTDPQFPTMDKLRAYVSGFFSGEITQRLLNIGIFTDNDGKLYALDVGIANAVTGKPTVEVTKKTDSSETYLLTVKVDTDGDGMPDTDKTHDYVYEKLSDGKWVFTHFEDY